jgi:hypothetical protein
MKMLYGLAATVLLLVSMFFAALPDTAHAAGTTLSAMTEIKQNADKALIAVIAMQQQPNINLNSGQHHKNLKHLHHYAQNNALVAAFYLQLLKEGKEVFADDAHACEVVTKLLLQAIALLESGKFDNVEHLIIIISVHMGKMPTGRAAAVIHIEIELKGSSHNSHDFLIIIINKRKRDGSVIIVVPGGGDDGHGHDNDDDDGHGGGHHDDDKDEDCREKGKIEMSRQCINGRVRVSFEVTIKCKKRSYKKTVTTELGPCCTMDANCDDHNPCTEDKCWQGICYHTKIHHPSPHYPHQCHD